MTECEERLLSFVASTVESRGEELGIPRDNLSLHHVFNGCGLWIWHPVIGDRVNRAPGQAKKPVPRALTELRREL